MEARNNRHFYYFFFSFTYLIFYVKINTDKISKYFFFDVSNIKSEKILYTFFEKKSTKIIVFSMNLLKYILF